ncbi:chemotaxis protein [Mobiluncus mulieris]|uniref:chemotaxis protein n=1 Tax=Mobiluncus mulieris TaxID=2052 RepID=UPI002431261C|nr:chemotaxis protein [Mobiluncus mulieris]
MEGYRRSKKIASDVKAISGQVHNNHGSSMKDTVDKMAQRMASVQQTQETMLRVQEEQGEGISQLRQSMTQMQRDMTQLREDFTVATRRMERIETEEHETHKEIFDRLNKKGKAS